MQYRNPSRSVNISGNAASTAGALRPQLNSLQAGRGFAAFAVVLSHADIAANAFLPSPTSGIASTTFSHGYLGVDFFFVLSGFIIYYITSRGASSPRTYLTQRAIRIYIPYLPIGIALGLAYSIFPDLSAGERTFGWFTTITLLPSEFPPALSVAWTLRHEILFYGIFGIAYFSGRLALVMVIWCCTILVSGLINLTTAYPFAQPIFGIINVEFFFGLGTAWMVLNNRKIPSALLTGGVFVSWASWGLFFADRSASPLIAIGFTCLILIAVQFERAGSLKIPRWLIFLGDASYSIYLVHNFIIPILVRACMRFPLLEDYAIAMVVMTTGSLFAGVLFHLAFERPALRFVRSFRFVRRGSRVLNEPALEQVR